MSEICCLKARWQRSECGACDAQEAWCPEHGTRCGCETPERGRDGLREAIEALADSWAGEADSLGPSLSELMLKSAARDLRRILAEHPATGDEERAYLLHRLSEAQAERDEWQDAASDVDSDNAAAGGAEGLAWDRTFKRAVNVGIDDFRMGRRSNDGMASDLAAAVLASDWLAAHVAQAKVEERADWSSWLDNWLSAVGPKPPTAEAIADWLRSGPRPFGVTGGGR